MPTNVLTSETASAPPSAAACAIGTMSVTFGVSLAISGSGQTSRHGAHDPARSRPDRWRSPMPPATLGHERFSSSAPHSRSRPTKLRRHLGNSSAVLPAMLPMIAVGKRAQIRQVVVEEMIDAVVVEADGVEHAARRLERSAAAGCRPAAGG